MNPILCPVRNGLNLTREAVRTFLAQDIPGGVEIMMIDNASQDGTTQWLRTQPVESVYFLPGKSVAASWNFGLREWFRRGAEYVLVVNNDVELRPDTYAHLAGDGGLFVTAVGTRDKVKIEPPYSIPDPSRKRPHPDMSCFLIRRECWETVGEFDEAFSGAYAEDSDIHVRIHHKGITACCLDLPFLHYGAQTLANASELEAAAIRLNADMNRTYFKQKWGVEVGSVEYYQIFSSSPPPETGCE